LLISVGILAIATIPGATTGFNIGHRPRFGTDRSQEGMMALGGGTFFSIV
jgi:hypothetical protein